MQQFKILAENLQANTQIWFYRTLARLRNFGGNNLSLGEYHLEQGNLGDAYMRFRMVAWKYPDNADAWAGAAEAALLMGKREEAGESVEKALKLNPHQPRALSVQDALRNRAEEPQASSSAAS